MLSEEVGNARGRHRRGVGGASLSTPELTLLEPLTRSEEWLRAARRARLLSWLSLPWMGAEGAIALLSVANGYATLANCYVRLGKLDEALDAVARGEEVVAVYRLRGYLRGGGCARGGHRARDSSLRRGTSPGSSSTMPKGRRARCSGS